MNEDIERVLKEITEHYRLTRDIYKVSQTSESSTTLTSGELTIKG